MTTKIQNYYIGVDISKDTFDVYRLPGDKHYTYQNDSKGFQAFIQVLKRLKGQVLIVCEATGGYEIPLAQKLHDKEFKMVIMNPRKIRDFGRAVGFLAKTDKLDAKLIALFAERVQPAYRKKDFSKLELVALHQRQEQLKTLIQAEKNRLAHTSKDIAGSISKLIDFLNNQLDDISKKLEQTINADCDLRNKVEIVQTCKGIGRLTAQNMLICVPELGTISKKPLTALVGVAPFNRDSGKMRGKRMISGGRYQARRSLYMSTLVAIKHNPPIRDFYNKLLEKGKPKKVAIIACLHKLLIIINAMVRDMLPWQKMNMGT